MDAFEVHMQFLTLMRGLNASQHSIHKVVKFALKFAVKCGDDLWECIVDECQKGSLNARINIFYMVDSLCEASLSAFATQQTAAPHQKRSSDQPAPSYVDFVRKDLPKLVDMVVPEGREGLPNLMSMSQILENWRVQRIVDPSVVDTVIQTLNKRKLVIHDMESSSTSKQFSKSEATKRIEEDRERHKRLRERRWVQAIPPPSTAAASLAFAPHLASFMPNSITPNSNETAETVDVEFENAWETTSDWNEDDEDSAKHENSLCFPGEHIGHREYEDMES